MFHKIENIRFQEDLFFLEVDGKEYEIDLKIASPLLLSSDEKARENYIVSPSGYGIHWPDIDEDLSISSLISM